jgi:hypothetical protein
VALELQPRLLRWVHHLLTSELKQKRIEVSQALLTILPFEEETSFQRIITGDESWFYLDYSSDHIWSGAGDDIPQRISRSIQSEKFLLTVLWSTRGPLVVKWMERGQCFNSAYFCGVVINELVKKLKTMRYFPRKNWYHLHLDNARPHVSQMASRYITDNGFVKMPHPPYSPDIAPSDFYLFGNIKTKLAKCHGTTREELFRNVQAILSSIPDSELFNVFKEWMRRLQQVIDSGGEYI